MGLLESSLLAAVDEDVVSSLDFLLSFANLSPDEDEEDDDEELFLSFS